MIIRSYDIGIRDIKRREIEGKGAMKMEKPRKEEQRAHFIRVSVSQKRLPRLKIQGIICEFHILNFRAGFLIVARSTCR